MELTGVRNAILYILVLHSTSRNNKHLGGITAYIGCVVSFGEIFALLEGFLLSLLGTKSLLIFITLLSQTSF